MVKKPKEIRQLQLEATEEPMILEGYAVVFNSPATHFYTEVIEQNAFDETDMSDVVMKYNHDDTHTILARTRNNSLTLKVDEKGLFIHAELIDTQANKDIYKMVQAGLLDKQSFAFTVAEDDYDYENDIRTIKKIDKLFDVSVVDVPWYDSTSIEAKGLDNSNEYLKKINQEKRKRLAYKLKKKELLNRF